MIIGLTGKNASGKGEVAEFLKTRNFEYFSLSDAIREELKARDKRVIRENMIVTGNELRKRFGPSVLADRILTHLEAHKNYVVDSIRNPFEVESLRRRQDFTLVEVTASPKIRFERLKNRNREGDPQKFEAFIRLDEREECTSQEGQQLSETARFADIVLENSTTLDDLHKRVLELIQKLSRGSYRPDWDQYFMSIAKSVALRSSCVKRKVAAVIVKDKRIVSTGYNGTPRGITNCNEGGCQRCNSMTPSGHGLQDCICSHAEENSITQAALHGVAIDGGSIYITYSPCLMCAKMIINSGLRSVIYNQHYSIAEAPLSLLKKAGVDVKSIEVGSISDKQPVPARNKKAKGTKNKMKRIKLVSFFVILTLLFQGIAFAQTAPPAGTQKKEEGVTLAAEKVDPAQIAKEEADQKAAAPQVKEKKKPLPIYLQPFEFVITSVVNAVMFWKKGDELNR